MTIGSQEFTGVKVHIVSEDQTLYMDWGDEDIHIIKPDGSNGGDAEIYLPVPHASNAYGEVWIQNNSTAGAIVRVKSSEGQAGSVHRNLSQQEYDIPRYEAAFCKYVPQRTNTDEKAGWIVQVGKKG